MLPTEEIEKRVVAVLQNVDERGYLRSREGTALEFKESFVFRNLPTYLRTIGAFANTRGGLIIFGVKDSPRIPVGVNRDQFDDIKTEKITTFLTEFFSPQIHWLHGIVEVNGVWFGYIFIGECRDKPAICKKNYGGDLKNGEIYFRYRGQTKVIEFPELKAIHDEIREREKRLWMAHVERIAKIGPQNVALVDLAEGVVESPSLTNRFLIDEQLLEQLKSEVAFVQEGQFSEVAGTPTLRLVGEVTPASTVVVPKLDPNKDYPYLAKHLAQELRIRPYDAQVLVWKLDLRGNLRYHVELKIGAATRNKYSKFALNRLRDLLESQADKGAFLAALSAEYEVARRGEKANKVMEKTA